MDIYCVVNEKVIRKSLFSDETLSIPNPSQIDNIPLNVFVVDRIAVPNSSQLFAPRNAGGYVIQAGFNNPGTTPLAGVYQMTVGAAFGVVALMVGKYYQIVTYSAGDDFTNIGAPENAQGEAFQATGTTPTNWTHGSTVIEMTAPVAFNGNAAAWQAAFNGTNQITNDGGVVITTNNNGQIFLVTWNNNGARAQVTGYAENLAPESLVVAGTLIQGAANVRCVQDFQTMQNPFAFVILPNAIPAAAITITQLQAGGGGHNAKYQISLPSYTFAGVFTLTLSGQETAALNWNCADSDIANAFAGLSQTAGLVITGQTYIITNFVAGDNFTNIGAGSNATGVVFEATGTTPTTWTNGSAVSAVGSTGNISVTQVGPLTFNIVFQGELQDTSMGAITGDASALTVPLGRSGVLQCDTPATALFLNGADQQATFFEIDGQPPGGQLAQFYQTNCSMGAAALPTASQTTESQQFLPSQINLLALPDADPHVNGAGWNNGGEFSISTG